MKILKIIIIFAISSFILLAVLIFLFAKIFLTPENIEASLRFEIEKRLRRPVSFEKIETNLLRGIHIRGVIVHKSLPWEKEDVFACEDIHIKPGLIPLIIKKLLIKKITLTNAKVNIQFGNGRPIGLYGDLSTPLSRKTPLGIIFLPDSVSAQDCKVIFTNLSDNFSFSLENIKASADDISLLFPFDFTILANLGGVKSSSIYCSGKYSLPKNELSADITTGKISLTVFKDYLNARNITIQKGFLTFESILKKNKAEPLSLNGRIALSNASIAVKPAASADEQIQMDGINTTINFQSIFDFPKKHFTIKEMHGDFLSSPFKAKGHIKKRAGGTFIAFTLNSKKFSLDNLFDKFSRNQNAPLKGLKLSGDVGLQLDLNGRWDKTFSPSFRVDLKGNKILYPPLGSLQPQLQGDLSVDRNKISITRLKVSTKNLSFTISGNISDYSRWPPKSSLKIVSSQINYDGLFAPAASQAVNEIGPFDLAALNFKGPIKLGNTSFLGIRLNDVKGNYLFENNKFFIKDLQGNIDGGSFNLSSTIDLAVKGLDYYLYFKLNDVPFKSIMSMFPAYDPRFIDGTITATCALNGNGTIPLNLLDSLKGDAFLYLSNGHINSPKFMPQLSYFIKSDELEKISFNKAQLQLKLRDGIVGLEGALINPKIELHPSGEVGFDSSLDLEANLKISPDLFTRSTKIAAYLPRTDGWVTLPLTIKGTFQEPNVSLSEETLSFIITETLPKLLLDMLPVDEDSLAEEIQDTPSEEVEGEVVEEADGETAEEADDETAEEADGETAEEAEKIDTETEQLFQ